MSALDTVSPVDLIEPVGVGDGRMENVKAMSNANTAVGGGSAIKDRETVVGNKPIASIVVPRSQKRSFCAFMGGKNVKGFKAKDSLMSVKEVMLAESVSKLAAIVICKNARTFQLLNTRSFPMPKVRNKEDAINSINNIGHHLVDYPCLDTVRRFVSNGVADIEDTLSIEDAEEAAKRRKVRATRVWRKTMKMWDNTRDSMNTLVCVLYFAQCVKEMVRALQKDSRECIGKLSVVRLKGVFVVILTDQRHGKRFPADWFMQHGQYTSVFIWVNVKEVSWTRNAWLPTVLDNMVKKEVTETTKKKKVTETTTKKKDVVTTPNTTGNANFNAIQLTRVSEATVCGVHFLNHIYQFANLLSTDTTSGNGAVMHYIHVEPSDSYNMNVDACTNEATVFRDDWWCTVIDKFVKKFASIIHVRRNKKISSQDPMANPTANPTGTSTVVEIQAA
jgi:hypothetical protein